MTLPKLQLDDGVHNYAVFGNPIKHSLSPIIHHNFAQQTQKKIQYQAICVRPQHLAEAISSFQQQGGLGLNITIPFKEAAYTLCCPMLSAIAKHCGSVNVIEFNQQTMMGHSTDGIGLVTDLQQNHDYSLQQKRVLILGAGGAVRAIIEPLLKAKVAIIAIVNRTIERAEKIAAQYKDKMTILCYCYDDLIDDHYELIINGTSLSLQNNVPKIPDQIYQQAELAYDMMYAKIPTCFMQKVAQVSDCYTVDGLGMLIEQAAESFLIWHKIRPNTKTLIKTLRHNLM